MRIKKPKAIKLSPVDIVESYLKIMENCRQNRNYCYEWEKCKDRKGYGRVRFRGKMYWTHRLMFAATNNGKLKHGLHVHHKCFNPSCNNPSHLEAMKSSINSGLKASTNF